MKRGRGEQNRVCHTKRCYKAGSDAKDKRLLAEHFYLAVHSKVHYLAETLRPCGRSLRVRDCELQYSSPGKKKKIQGLTFDPLPEWPKVQCLAPVIPGPRRSDTCWCGIVARALAPEFYGRGVPSGSPSAVCTPPFLTCCELKRTRRFRLLDIPLDESRRLFKPTAEADAAALKLLRRVTEISLLKLKSQSPTDFSPSDYGKQTDR